MKDYARYATGVLFIVGALILIILGFNLIKNILSSDSDSSNSNSTPARNINLQESAKAGKAVRYTMIGSVVGDEEHRSIRITIDQNKRRIDILQGYNEQIIKTQEIANNPKAYEVFIAAINGGGFTRSALIDGNRNELEKCPLGQRFHYEVDPDTAGVFRTWSTSCGIEEGDFRGNTTLIRTLFQRQIPKYNQFVQGVKLSP